MMERLARVRLLAQTALALGPSNIARFMRYRLLVKRLRYRPGPAAPRGPYFRPVPSGAAAATLAPMSGWKDGVLLFGRHAVALPDGIPDFLANPFNGARAGGDEPWWMVPDFTPETGDIKAIWELSRLAWVPAFAQQALAGDGEAIERLNRWLSHWCAQNQPQLGPNWRCGQETSVRVMHLAAAATLLDQVADPLPDLTELIALHAERILPTIGYAIAQDNNHATSEAAALFIAGTWPALAGEARAAEWRASARKWLEDRVARLVDDDGTFSLYSANYHRVLLDTLCLVEIWRRRLDLPAFSPTFYRKAGLVTEWLRALTDPSTGDTPNVGNNDGARLVALSDTPFRDYRPSVQLGASLFLDRAAYDEGPWNDQLRWWGLVPPQQLLPLPTDLVATDGGFATFRRGKAALLLRFPRYRFRPAQADALHLDLTIDGENWLRDGGSYSYSQDPALMEYFGGVQSHNTVQFDDRDQMPRLGRFLYAAWPHADVGFDPTEQSPDEARFAARYRDWMGATHRRSLIFTANALTVTDEVAGFADRAVLRWRLAPRDWRRTEDGIACHDMRIAVHSDVPVARIELTEGLESRHYFEKNPLPVLEVELRRPSRIVSEFAW